MNCQNCGAPIHGNICEYCGTVFDSPTDSKIRDYEEKIAKLKADLANSAQSDYLLSIMGKWVASPLPSCEGIYDPCKDCEHFKIEYEPYKSGGVCWDFGRALCMKHDLVTDFISHKKFEKLECVDNAEHGN